MSFNEVSEFRTLLGEIDRKHPDLIKAGERSLLWVIISYPDGCFIGERELSNQTGLAVTTLRKYLGRYKKLNVITREQSFARKGLRQCYGVSMTELRNLLSLSPEIALELKNSKVNSVLPITEELKTFTESANAYHRGDPYKDNTNYKYDKDAVKGINLERFYYVISELPKTTQDLIKPGGNYEKLLDKCERQGTSLEVIKRLLGRVNFSNAVKVGALLEHQLRVICGELKPNESSSMPPHCGRDFCDPVTRTFPDFSEDSNGVMTNKCLKCNPDYYKIKNLESNVKDFQLNEMMNNVFRKLD